MSPVQNEPFFLIGHDRSGTTMLRLILDRGAVAIPAESMFLVDFASVRRAGGLELPERAERLLREVWSHPHVKLWRLSGDPPPVPPGLSSDDTYRFVVGSPFVAYAEREGKARWGDKTPAYLHHVDELATVWPEARFVVLVRDGRDVALSVMPLPFGPNNVWAAAKAWSRAIRLGREAEARHSGRVLSVRYEDVVADPESEVRRICEFLGLDYDPDLLAIERTDPTKFVDEQSGWFRGIWSGINANAVGKWRREMTADQQRVFESIAGAELDLLGYERSSSAPEPAPSTPAATVYAGHDAALRLVNFVRLRLVQERGREVGYVVRRKLAGAGR